jgi:uncharacterized damage-inducible protein DinB
MNTILHALACYNSNVNLELAGILREMPAEKLSAKTGAYFPTILDAAVHILINDINMVKRFKTAFPESIALGSTLLLSDDTARIKKEAESGLEKFLDYRKQLDPVISAFVDELDGETLDFIIKYNNYRGEPVEAAAWKLLLTIFNHQAHHRGGISVMLDIAGVKNDFSGTLAKI